ncbi:MAG TPA: cupin domain-containing protein [Jatrophihabitantaceae bacterium]|nr:cupin domain-containing protein [Jatrophihabitantaceae bacterium]
MPLLTRAAELGRTFDDLLDTAAVDELVSRRGLRTPFLRMARDGTVLPAKEFTRGGGAGAGIADQAADDRVLAQLADGATLVLQGLHRTWPPLVSFGSQLADELGHPVQINAYITPSQNRGFAAHYDVHDVFVLQVSGRKHWRIHAPVVTDPLDNQNWEKSRAEVAAQAEREPVLDCVLEPGDALYLPRGTIHAAEALGETSIHVTVGIHPITRYELVRQVLDAAQHDDALRASLPMGVDLGDPGVLAPELAATLDALRSYLDHVPVEGIARAVADRLAAQTRPEPLAPLAQLVAADGLGPDTELRMRGALRYRVTEDADRVEVRTLDRTLSLPLAAAPALKMALSGEVFTAVELPGLDGDEQLTVARRLLREGLLVIA